MSVDAPLTVPLHVAAARLGISAALARREAGAHGQVCGVRALRVGRVWRVPTADLVALAGDRGVTTTPQASAAGPLRHWVAASSERTAMAPAHPTPTPEDYLNPEIADLMFLPARGEVQ